MSGNRLWWRLRYGVTVRTDWTGGTVLTTQRTLTRERADRIIAAWKRDPLWMRLVARLSTADWWSIGTAAVVGTVGGFLVAVWYR